jgi:membrane fusion protein, multidrug efflux system
VNRQLAATLLCISAAFLITTRPQSSEGAEQGPSPSVLVQTTTLQKGALPRIITVFGKAEASASMQEDITAPASAVVDAIFVKIGQQVKPGDRLARLGPTAETAAAYRKATTALDNARGLVERTRTLLAQHLATRQQLADAQKALSDAQATLDALVAGGASTPRTLTSPDAGVVTSISVSYGAIVTAGTALLSIARANGLVLQAGAPPEQAKEISNGDAATISPLGGGDGVRGTVLLRGSIVDAKTGLVPVEMALPRGALLAGQAAMAKIVTGIVEGYLVPHKAILVDDSGAPYVVQAKGMIAHRIPVKILLSDGTKDVIAGALDPQAALVLAGNYQVKDGMHVRIADPAKKPDGQ